MDRPRIGDKPQMSQRLNGLKIAILATEGVEEAELTGPRAAFDAAGATTELVSPEAGTIRAFEHHDPAGEYVVDRLLSDASAERYDALFLPGGALNPDTLRMDASAVAFVKAFFEAHKPVAAICHAPWLLVEAGVARGRTMTSWPSIQTDVRNAGATWVDREVVVDGDLVTSRKPDDIPAFNAAAIGAFAKTPAKA